MKNILLVPELRELIAQNDAAALSEFCQSTHPATVADFLDGLSIDETHSLLSLIDSESRSAIFPYLDITCHVELASLMTQIELVDLISALSHDERVDFIQHLPETQVETLMPAIAQAAREDIRKLASYSEGSAGAVMTSDYASLAPDLTVRQAIEKLRLEAPDKETIYYAYVTDDQHKLVGFVSLKDLVLAEPEAQIKEIMHTDVISARSDEDQEEVARKIEKFDLLAIPILNGGGKLLGIVTYDDALDILREEQTEDIERIMGLTGAVQEEDYLSIPSAVHFRRRAAWIAALAVLSFFPGFIFEHFTKMLSALSILAFYIPMLMDTGGNTGSQSATVVIRALALQQIKSTHIMRVLWKELRISIMLGFVIVAVAFGRMVLFRPTEQAMGGLPVCAIAGMVCLALALQVVTSTLIGAILPLAAWRAKLDPAVVASPALTTVVDITGLLIYFGIAKLLLGV